MINSIIPARGGSKGIPKKNIIQIGNHPLIAYSIVAAQLCESIDRVIVSTDDCEIGDIARKYGAEVPFMRPAEYATDESSDLGFLKHYFDNIGGEEVVLLRPTSSFRDPEFMNRGVKMYNRKKLDITGMRSAHAQSQPVHKMFNVSDERFEKLFDNFRGIEDYTNLPRQNFPETYMPDGHIDIVKRSTIESGSVFGDEICACIGEKIVDIDDEYDLKIASLLVDSQFDHLSKHIKG